MPAKAIIQFRCNKSILTSDLSNAKEPAAMTKDKNMSRFRMFDINLKTKSGKNMLTRMENAIIRKVGNTVSGCVGLRLMRSDPSPKRGIDLEDGER